ncbi:MAG: CBS domain-containing protein [Woeseiaceae bacterium]|nr:CBS domain-containing protein [Woeseiaceae bacterium]
MKLQRLAVMTGVMRHGMTVRDFFEEAVRSNVPGLPYIDENDRIVGRVSVRDVFKHIAVPNSYLRLADAIGDQTNRLDMSEQKILDSLALPVEDYLLENIPSVSPASSLIKALAIMEAYNTHYIFLIEDGKYMGIVTRMVIANRLLDWLAEVDRGESLPGNRQHL